MTSSQQSRQPFRSGAGRICLDFVRTLRYRDRPHAEEELATPERLASWIAQFGQCIPSVAITPKQLADARALREAISELIATALDTHGARSCSAGARRTVNATAALPTPAPRLQPDGQIEYRAENPVAATLAVIARDALALIDSPDLDRVRSCANPDCRVLFIDHSRPGTRRWCSMQTCGNRAKKATQRSRPAD